MMSDTTYITDSVEQSAYLSRLSKLIDNAVEYVIYDNFVDCTVTLLSARANITLPGIDAYAIVCKSVDDLRKYLSDNDLTTYQCQYIYKSM